VVDSPLWNGKRGAVLWGNGTRGVSSIVCDANSRVGSNPGDFVGSEFSAPSNGNYVVARPAWNDGRGAVAWGALCFGDSSRKQWRWTNLQLKRSAFGIILWEGCMPVVPTPPLVD
jgi:hypothetical protein